MDDPLTQPLRLQIESACARFEAAWDRGDRPAIEDFLPAEGQPGRAVLFRKLLECEVRRAADSGSPLIATDYADRFPGYREIVFDVLDLEDPGDAKPVHDITQVIGSVVCPKCAASNPTGLAACHVCGSAFAAAETQTPEIPTPRAEANPPSTASYVASSETPTISHGRFVPGEVINERYRIVAMLGRGGMGEVYRADDLKLGQPVALKFLPAEMAAKPRLLEYFHNEVRLARQIAHPHVCRVFDIGEVEGHSFISMEYIDGESLADLLRRIGRLPPDKAIELARQLCAGLAAAHAVGVLHRDLKPANVMIDGRGRAKITDFGLARRTDQKNEGEPVVGTPAYMAPEQFHENRTGVRTDIFALGLVLFEMFTGRRARNARNMAELRVQIERENTADFDDLSAELDPRIRRTLERCLARDPQERPRSAAEVAAGLPGLDPLAAAIAAGETPSPEMVAAAGEEGALTKPWAIACFVATLLLLVLVGGLATQLQSRLGLSRSEAALADTARDLLKQFGHERAPADEAWGTSVDRGVLRETVAAGIPWDHLEGDSEQVMYFWYRSSRAPLVPTRPDWTGDRFLSVDETRPSPADPGMVSLRLSPTGRLLALQVVSANGSASDHSEVTEPSWDNLLAAAGWENAIGSGALVPAEPPAVLPVFAEQRMAWTDAEGSVRLVAGAIGSKVVYFRQTSSGAEQEGSDGFSLAAGNIFRTAFMLLWIPTLLIACVLLARRNLRLGRGDRRSAGRLALLLIVTSLLAWLLKDQHVAGPQELDLLLTAIAGSLLLAGTVACSYLAIEPHVRRIWPGTLVASTRLLSGRFRDPLVGRDLAAGTLAGAAAALLKLSIALVPLYLGWASNAFPSFLNLQVLSGGREAFGEMVLAADQAILYSIFNQLLFLLLLFVLVRRTWVAAALYVAFLSLLVAVQFQPFPLALALTLVEMTVTVFLFLRCGLLAVAAMHFVRLLLKFPITFDFSLGYADSGLMALTVIVALAACALWLNISRPPSAGEALVAGGTGL